MIIDIHALLEKNPITKKMLQPKFGYKYLRPYNPLDKQMLYNKQTGDIYKCYEKPKDILDKIASKHDTCYSVGKNKNECDRIMVKEIDNTPYKEKPFGTFAIKQIIDTKQKLGAGNFRMDDLSEELNKGIINKFKRKKVIINHINEIHSCDLVDMTKYSRMNKEYKHIFTNVDIFSKIAYAYASKIAYAPIKSKKYMTVNFAFKKYS